MQDDKFIFPVIKIDYSSNVNEFIGSWKKLYDYKDYEEVYYKLLRKKYLEPKDLYNLFKWKNGMDLSGKKKESYEKIEIHLDLINKFRHEPKTIEDYDNHFRNISTIWRIFLYHIIQPKVYPIFDQHVYRAYAAIKKLERKELPLNNKEKLRIYKEEYLPFFFDFLSIGYANDFISEHNEFDADKALWVFGRALKNSSSLFKTEEKSNESPRL